MQLRIRILHLVGRAFGILFHVDGLPYGAAPRIKSPSSANYQQRAY